MDFISIKACAKINLFLDITEKRPDGFHNLRSLMQSIDLMDFVRIRKAESEISVGCDIRELCGESNIAHKAAKIFFDETGISGGAEIFIEKHIPIEAGLAGGSADAAAVIFGLNELYETGFPDDILRGICEKCGSDVAFSLFGGTKLCEGKGEILSPLPELPDCFFVIVKPDFGMSTAESYRIFDSLYLSTAEHGDFSSFISASENSDLPALCGKIFNALEKTVPHDEISAIKSELLEHGAMGSAMTGSGTAVFGVFKELSAAVAAKNALSKKYSSVFLHRPSACGVSEDNSFPVFEHLRKLSVPFEIVEHCAVYTMDEMSLLGIFGRGTVGKNLFLRDPKGKRHFLVFIRGDKHADLASLEEKIGIKHCSFASAERLKKYLGLSKGSVSPLGVINDKESAVEFILDKDFSPEEIIGVHPNQNVSTLFLSFGDLVKIISENGNSIEYIKI